MKKFSWYIDNSEEIIAAVLLLATVALLFVQVVARYFFGKAIAWTEEMSRYTFLWMIYIGASLAAKHDAHIRVTAHLKVVPGTIRRYVLLVSDLIWLAFNAVVIVEGIRLFQSMGEYPLRSASMGWDVRYVFLILPIGFVLMSIRILQVQYRRFRGLDEAVIGVEREL